MCSQAQGPTEAEQGSKGHLGGVAACPTHPEWLRPSRCQNRWARGWAVGRQSRAPEKGMAPARAPSMRALPLGAPEPRRAQATPAGRPAPRCALAFCSPCRGERCKALAQDVGYHAGAAAAATTHVQTPAPARPGGGGGIRLGSAGAPPCAPGRWSRRCTHADWLGAHLGGRRAGARARRVVNASGKACPRTSRFSGMNALQGVRGAGAITGGARAWDRRLHAQGASQASPRRLDRVPIML